MFATSDPVVRKLFEELPNAEKCSMYQFQFKKGARPPQPKPTSKPSKAAKGSKKPPPPRLTSNTSIPSESVAPTDEPTIDMDVDVPSGASLNLEEDTVIMDGNASDFVWPSNQSVNPLDVSSITEHSSENVPFIPSALFEETPSMPNTL